MSQGSYGFIPAHMEMLPYHSAKRHPCGSTRSSELEKKPLTSLLPFDFQPASLPITSTSCRVNHPISQVQ